jgi:protein arginine N-methyltransferase 5
MPLQPLADHLSSATYEVFEMDPVKYRLYQSAVRRFLETVSTRSAASGAAMVRVAVVGAGRGPLVRGVLRAAAEAGVTVSVLAVEKNPNAVIQ